MSKDELIDLLLPENKSKIDVGRPIDFDRRLREWGVREQDISTFVYMYPNNSFGNPINLANVFLDGYKKAPRLIEQIKEFMLYINTNVLVLNPTLDDKLDGINSTIFYIESDIKRGSHAKTQTHQSPDKPIPNAQDLIPEKEFAEILNKVIKYETVEEIFEVPGVKELLQKHYTARVFEIWKGFHDYIDEQAKAKPIKKKKK